MEINKKLREGLIKEFKWNKELMNNQGLLYFEYYENDANDCNAEFVVCVHGMGGNRNAWIGQLPILKNKFNVVLIDLYGHGRSKDMPIHSIKNASYQQVCNDILKVLDYLSIEQAHFMGLSLGTVLLIAMAKEYPERCRSIILTGAVVKYGFKMLAILIIGCAMKNVVPYMWLYKLFSLIVMPRKNHQHVRGTFEESAKIIGGLEFFAWLRVCLPFNKLYPAKELEKIKIHKYIIAGDQDYMYYRLILKYASKDKYSTIKVIKNCGHICNIERVDEFNGIVVECLKDYQMQYNTQRVNAYRKAQ